MPKLESMFEEHSSSVVNLKSQKYAQWTDASLFPEATLRTVHSADPVALCRDWQSFGQQLIHYSASRTMQDLFPIGKAFFQLVFDPAAEAEASQSLQRSPEQLRADLVGAANDASNRLHWRGNYARLSWGMKVLLVTGNVLLFKRADGAIVPYTTLNYSILRDGAGSPLQLVLKERYAYRMLPPEVQAGFPSQSDRNAMVDVYTGVEWQAPQADGSQEVRIWQEAGTWASAPKPMDAQVCPFIPLYVDLIAGESYGRGRVEANSGDFARYSELSRALTLYEIEACKVVKAVRNGAGVSDLDSLQEAETGEYVLVDPEAVKAIEFGDAKKIAELRQELQAIEARLSRTFGYGGNMRDGERVTAYEVSLSAAETDRAQGGLYSTLSSNLHGPLALLLLQETHPGVLSLVLSNRMHVGVITGIAALGQASEVQSLLRGSQEASVINQALSAISQKFSPEKIADMVLLATGFVPDKVERSEEELAQIQASVAPVDPSNPENLTAAIEGTLSSV